MTETPVTVEFRHSGVTKPWDPSAKSLLEFAEALGVDPAFSCRQGYCHTCQCTLVSGEIEYTDPDADPPSQAGEILICCSVPKTAVVIDI